MALSDPQLDKMRPSLVNRLPGKKANDAKVPSYIQIKRHMLIYHVKHLAPIQPMMRNHNERAVAKKQKLLHRSYLFRLYLFKYKVRTTQVTILIYIIF